MDDDSVAHVLYSLLVQISLAAVAKYKEKITESLMLVTRAGVTWWLDLILVKDERASLKVMMKCKLVNVFIDIDIIQ
jgi:hypothetical protein